MYTTSNNEDEYLILGNTYVIEEGYLTGSNYIFDGTDWVYNPFAADDE